MDIIEESGLELRVGFQGILSTKLREEILSLFDLKARLKSEEWSETYKIQWIQRWSQTFMKRSQDKTTSMLFEAIKFFRPKHGDIILKLDEDDAGYRNEGVWFWDDDLGLVDSDRNSDDYGSVPKQFSFPKFPVEYFRDCMTHNNVINVDFTNVNITFTSPEQQGFRFHVVSRPEITFDVIPWDDEPIDLDDIRNTSSVLVLDVVNVINDNTYVCNLYVHVKDQYE